jgi:hypothetical protein
MQRKLIVLLLLFTSACSFHVQVITPEPSTDADGSNSQTATAPVDATVTFMPSATAPPLSTLTPEIPSTTLPRDLGTYPIRFDPNGTYVDITDTILAGTGKTYSIRASKGQVMSVSIRQSTEQTWAYMPLKIVAADGITLCPSKADMECTFWRGILPATQDYFVTLTPASDALDFVMRVAINPPGVTSQSFQYQGKHQNVSFSYSDEFAPVRFPGAEIYKIPPELTLEFINTDSYTNTNLIEAYFLFGVTDETDVVTNCTQPISFGGPESVIRAVSINGIQFVRSKGGGVAAGNTYEQTYYRTAYTGVCYEITFFVHYGNIGAYAPDSGVKEFDATALMKKFEDILSTLIIK